MAYVLFGIGGLSVLVGLFCILWGRAEIGFSYANTVIEAGVMALMGGLIVLALGAVLRALQRLEARLAAMPPLRLPFGPTDPAAAAGPALLPGVPEGQPMAPAAPPLVTAPEPAFAGARVPADVAAAAIAGAVAASEAAAPLDRVTLDRARTDVANDDDDLFAPAADWRAGPTRPGERREPPPLDLPEPPAPALPEPRRPERPEAAGPALAEPAAPPAPLRRDLPALDLDDLLPPAPSVPPASDRPAIDFDDLGLEPPPARPAADAGIPAWLRSERREAAILPLAAEPPAVAPPPAAPRSIPVHVPAPAPDSFERYMLDVGMPDEAELSRLVGPPAGVSDAVSAPVAAPAEVAPPILRAAPPPEAAPVADTPAAAMPAEPAEADALLPLPVAGGDALPPPTVPEPPVAAPPAMVRPEPDPVRLPGLPLTLEDLLRQPLDLDSGPALPPAAPPAPAAPTVEEITPAAAASTPLPAQEQAPADRPAPADGEAPVAAGADDRAPPPAMPQLEVAASPPAVPVEPEFEFDLEPLPLPAAPSRPALPRARQLEVAHDPPAAEAPPIAADQGEPERSVVRSGMIGEMQFVIYSDGSIEARMPGEAPMVFPSLQALREHVGV